MDNVYWRTTTTVSFINKLFHHRLVRFFNNSVLVGILGEHLVSFAFLSDVYQPILKFTALVDLKDHDYKKYIRRIRQILNFNLLIIDDFLLNTITDERQIKVLVEVLEKRIELSRNTIVCSQREPDQWQAMIMNDAVIGRCHQKASHETLCHHDHA